MNHTLNIPQVYTVEKKTVWYLAEVVVEMNRYPVYLCDRCDKQM